MTARAGVRPATTFVALMLVVGLAAASCAGGSDEDEEPVAQETAPAARPAVAARGRLTARPREPRRQANGGPGLRAFGQDAQALLYVPSGRSRGLVVVLYGAGGSPQDALGLLQPLADDAGLILLAPRSQGGTWDAALGGFGPDVAEIDRLLREVFDRYPVDPKAVAVAGFSDGASYALSIGLTNGDLFRSVIAFSPGFIALVERHGSPRVFVSHGIDDPVLPIDEASRYWVPLLRARYQVRYREFPGGHEVPPRIAREAVDWLAAGRRAR
jgi:phospholipase/carboxylesterase